MVEGISQKLPSGLIASLHDVKRILLPPCERILERSSGCSRERGDQGSSWGMPCRGVQERG
jgi:hypothetical protein